MSDTSDLESKLAEDPFDLETRKSYAEVLAKEGRPEDCAKQWRIVLKQEASARAHLGLALSLFAMNDEAGASDHLALARKESDYAESVQSLSLAQKQKLGTDEKVAPMRVLRGGGSAPEGRVISIHRSETIRFSDVAGMDDLKKILRLRIIEPFLKPSLFQRFKKRAGGGVLLYGSPGCGKTMMAKAIATECKASFTAVGISDVLNMWIGESERGLAEIFEKARSEKPAVLFFDELDALAFSRSKANSDHTRTLVNEFLNQLDGINRKNDGLLVLGATNLPWDVDSAMKRPGRFDRMIFVPPPDANARRAMFEMKLLDVPVGPIDLDPIVRKTEGFSGADIDGLIDSAKDDALLREIDQGTETSIKQEDLLNAAELSEPTCIEWLKTARNLVKFGGAGSSYKEVEKYLRSSGLY